MKNLHLKVFISWRNYRWAMPGIERTKLGNEYETGHFIIISKFHETIRYRFSNERIGCIWQMWRSICCKRNARNQFDYQKGKGHFIVYKSLQNEFRTTNNTVWFSKAIFCLACAPVDKPLRGEQIFIIELIIECENTSLKCVLFSDYNRP